MKANSYKLGTAEAKIGVKSNEKILEALNSYREITVKNRRAYYVQNISKLRMDLASVVARRNFMPNLSKYIFETALIVGSFLISGIQFALYNSSQAIASLAVFFGSFDENCSCDFENSTRNDRIEIRSWNCRKNHGHY